MDNSSSPASSRPTLTLKVGARKSPRETKAVAVPLPKNTSKSKPGAHWSDEYKVSMQADMDALTSR